MTFKVCYWDELLSEQRERDSTPEEDAQRDIDILVSKIPIVPQRIPMLNAHLVLISVGWMDGINAYINALSEPDRSKAFAYLNLAQTMDRNHQLVRGIPAALGKTEEDVDQLFIRAASLDV